MLRILYDRQRALEASCPCALSALFAKTSVCESVEGRPVASVEGISPFPVVILFG